MTADQIRAATFESDNGAWECARWLQEIAAQLAEQRLTSANVAAQLENLNDKLETITALSTDENPAGIVVRQANPL